MGSEDIVITKDVLALAATAASIQIVANTFDHPIRLKSAEFVVAVAVTAHADNYRTFNVKKGAGGTAVVTPQATTVLGLGDLAVGDVVDLPLVTTGGGSTDLRRLEPGQVHEVSAAHAASGVAIGGTWQLTYEPVRSLPA